MAGEFVIWLGRSLALPNPRLLELLPSLPPKNSVKSGIFGTRERFWLISAFDNASTKRIAKRNYKRPLFENKKMNNSQTPTRLSFAKKIMVACFMLLVALPATVSAHQWTIDNKKVDAYVKNFDGRNVTFVLKNNQTKTVSVQDLNREDLAYLKTLVELQNAMVSSQQSARRTAIEYKQLQVQLEQYRSQWYELWVVHFVGPSGERFWWAYPVRNSYQAMTNGSRQFPGARIVAVRKLTRQW